MSRVVCLWLMGCLLAGCGGAGSEDGGGSVGIDDLAVPPGFFEQPAMAALRERTPAGMGFEPGTTDWQGVGERGLPGPVCAEGDHAVSALAEELMPATAGGVSRTVRHFRSGDRLLVLVQRFGFEDDSLAGDDIRLLSGRDDDCWIALVAERRLHCRRGIAESGRCQ